MEVSDSIFVLWTYIEETVSFRKTLVSLVTMALNYKNQNLF